MPRLLFCSYHCYSDQSSGAALCTRELLELLSQRDWSCRVFCGPHLDFEETPPLAQILAAQQIPFERRQTSAGSAPLSVFHLQPVLDKLTAFHRQHDTGMPEVLRDLQAAIAEIPQREYAPEAKPLQEEYQKIQDRRRRGPQLMGDILPLVFARLGVGVVQSNESGE
jgi:hypothetical protein